MMHSSNLPLLISPVGTSILDLVPSTGPLVLSLCILGLLLMPTKGQVSYVGGGTGGQHLLLTSVILSLTHAQY
jgi:hypothetical protein